MNNPHCNVVGWKKQREYETAYLFLGQIRCQLGQGLQTMRARAQLLVPVVIGRREGGGVGRCYVVVVVPPSKNTPTYPPKLLTYSVVIIIPRSIGEISRGLRYQFIGDEKSGQAVPTRPSRKTKYSVLVLSLRSSVLLQRLLLHTLLYTLFVAAPPTLSQTDLHAGTFECMSGAKKRTKHQAAPAG